MNLAAELNLDKLTVQDRVSHLINKMSLAEKIGQMCQIPGQESHISHDMADALRQGKVGSILNEVDRNTINELQRICIEESRLGIPLLIGRDVIHGFKTIFPIPLGQAASWDPEIIEQAARVSAVEAAAIGINWTFAPMIDITRDPRWGRIAECLGEDPYLCGELGKAMVKGFQSDDLSDSNSIAACAKHFAGYGGSEAGRDYNTVLIPENEMRNVHLRPFKAVADAGVATFMSAFCDLNGVPASGNQWLMKDLLREEWAYQGMVVSDWASIVEMTVHGFTRDDEGAAREAVLAGIDMEMASQSYKEHLHNLIEEGEISPTQIDEMVARILTLKFELGLFENPYVDGETEPLILSNEHKNIAKEAAIKSCVLLKNEGRALPLSKENTNSIAVIGPLADDGYEQMGTWVFDGQAENTVSCLQGLIQLVGDEVEIKNAPGLPSVRSKDESGFDYAIEVARQSDAAIVVVGEESFMSGEAHSRAEIGLPGHQEQLIGALSSSGTPIILVIMAGRPLTLEHVVDKVDAILYAWHPGTMGGPAIADLIFGEASPSGKLPTTFPKKVGQIPIYYSHKNTGRPPSDENCVDMDDAPIRAPQTSLGMTSFHLDAGFRPAFPFGFGLSYGQFHYLKITTSHSSIKMGDSIQISAAVMNSGEHEAEEVVQLYVRDLVGSTTRPVKELKGFKRIRLKPGARTRVSFVLHTDDLAFYGRGNELVCEPGQFHVWIGGSSEANLWAEFEVHE
jgi:beta-glucosidase